LIAFVQMPWRSRTPHPFNLQTGQTRSGLEIQIPQPVWHIIRGKLTGVVPENLANISVQFVRHLGMLDGSGSSGQVVHPDGTFQHYAQLGRYRLPVWEMTPMQPGGCTSLLHKLTSLEIAIGDRDMEGVKLRIESTVA
jgi:hypothetical protein